MSVIAVDQTEHKDHFTQTQSHTHFCEGTPVGMLRDREDQYNRVGLFHATFIGKRMFRRGRVRHSRPIVCYNTSRYFELILYLLNSGFVTIRATHVYMHFSRGIY